MNTAIELRPNQLALVKSTIAKDCNDQEFSLFMEAARSYGLDPFRKQIMPLVFSKDKADKRRMSIIISRDGLRVIAQRCKNYRPASEKAEIIYDETLKGPLNPKGIVSATVYLWQQDNMGNWHKVVGEALWDEFAPITDEWGENSEGKWKPTGQKKLDASGNWARMPVVMITKCAEAQALRAGWPDQFGGIYAEEEMDQALAQDASEMVRKEEERQRLERVGGLDSITITWGDNWKLDQVPVGELADRCFEFIRKATPEDVKRWSMANTEPLRQFWARSPSDAFGVKKAVEAKTEAIKTQETAE